MFILSPVNHWAVVSVVVISSPVNGNMGYALRVSLDMNLVVKIET